MSRSPVGEKMERLTIQLRQRHKEMLREMADQTGAMSMTEVIVRSLALYHTLARAHSNGDVVIIRDSEGKEKEVVFF